VLSRIWLRIPVAVLIFVLCAAIVPRWWCGRDGHRWFDGDLRLASALAREVATTAMRGVTEKDFTNNNPIFKGEWQFGTYQMTALGLLQIVDQHPALRAEFMPVIEASIDRMLSPEVRAFDTTEWNEDALDTLDSANGHAAYLGYMNIVLGVHRRVEPASRFAELNNRISRTLARRLLTSPKGILETYPGEAFPVDNASVVGSLLLHTRNTGENHDQALARPLAHFRGSWRDPKSRLLYQAVDFHAGLPADRARASGTALAAVLLAYAERDISRELYQAVQARCSGSLFGFGFVDEYPDNERGRGDVDSGPLIFGISPSGCGFSIAAARAFGDRDTFVRLYRTVHLMGTPIDIDDRRTYVIGGPLGNAIMLAMLTTSARQP
jgi:hypothetical protein